MTDAKQSTAAQLRALYDKSLGNDRASLAAAMDAGDMLAAIRASGGYQEMLKAAVRIGMTKYGVFRRERLAEYRQEIELRDPDTQAEAWHIVELLEAERRAKEGMRPRGIHASGPTTPPVPPAPVPAAEETRRPEPTTTAPAHPPSAGLGEALKRGFQTFTTRYGRALAEMARPAAPAPIRPPARRIETAVATEKGPGRAVRPHEGPSYDKLVAAAKADAKANAALDDVMAGKVSVTQALISIGLKRPQSRYSYLVSAWEHASEGDRDAFLTYLDMERRRREAA